MPIEKLFLEDVSHIIFLYYTYRKKCSAKYIDNYLNLFLYKDYTIYTSNKIKHFKKITPEIIGWSSDLHKNCLD